jgi:hypothetical protein
MCMLKPHLALVKILKVPENRSTDVKAILSPVMPPPKKEGGPKRGSTLVTKWAVVVLVLNEKPGPARKQVLMKGPQTDVELNASKELLHLLQLEFQEVFKLEYEMPE